MVRWIAFDEETADAIISRFKRGASELHHGNPLDAALNYGKASLLLMPCSVPGKVLLARIEPKAEQNSALKTERKLWWKHEPHTVEDFSEPISYEATGFLGLIDEPVFNRPPQPARPAPKKKWWQRKSA
jgi:hypothetical protein